MASFLTLVSVLAATLLWSLILKPCLGIRDGGQGFQSSEGGKVNKRLYNIELIVTRHGLSCANIVSEFGVGTMMGKYKNAMGNRKIEDPILAQAGVDGSLEMREICKSVKPDAVLASTLLRAIETAMLQYPSDAVHVVPWIRESSAIKKYAGEGKDNLPTDIHDQVNRLKAELNSLNVGNVTVTDWTDMDNRKDNHDWEKFKEFLAVTFLPTKIKKWNKGPGSNITLAVVTHSNFMKNVPDIATDCGGFWQNKPYNNQAVSISYVLEFDDVVQTNSNIQGRKPQINETYATLTQNAGCKQIAPGIPYHDRKLCRRDIGPHCENDITGKDLLLPKLLENDIKAKQAKYDAVFTKISKALEDVTKEINDDNDRGQAPSNHKLKAHNKKMKPLYDKGRALDAEIKALQNMHCIGGGHPASES